MYGIFFFLSLHTGQPILQQVCSINLNGSRDGQFCSGQEAVNQVFSRIKDGCQHKSDAKEHIERMEMAHIKLEDALDVR